MARGGRRSGRPGVSYPNRSDLTPTAAPGQTYGQAGAQMQAQQQMPIAPQPTPGAGGGEPPAPGVVPGQFGDLARPTERPDEPLTAGAPVGPGPNSLSLPSTLPPPDPLLTTLTALRGLGDQMHPMLAGVVQQLQVAHGNGQGG